MMITMIMILSILIRTIIYIYIYISQYYYYAAAAGDAHPEGARGDQALLFCIFIILYFYILKISIRVPSSYDHDSDLGVNMC